MTDIIVVAGTTIAAYFFLLSFPAVTSRPPPFYHSLFKPQSITPHKTTLPYLYKPDNLRKKTLQETIQQNGRPTTSRRPHQHPHNSEPREDR